LIFHRLAKEYGWNQEQVLDLTPRQTRMYLTSEEKLSQSHEKRERQDEFVRNEELRKAFPLIVSRQTAIDESKYKPIADAIVRRVRER
jgi:hypothetical protein